MLPTFLDNLMNPFANCMPLKYHKTLTRHAQKPGAGGRRNTAITEDIARDIFNRHLLGQPTSQIAKAHNVSYGVVRGVKAGRTWGDITQQVEYDWRQNEERDKQA